MTKSLRLQTLIAVALSIPTLAAAAQEAPPTADTFVSSATPTTNYGRSTIDAVGPGTTTYIRFNLTGIPTGSTVAKATLRLYVDGVLGGGQFDVYNLPSTPLWTETTLTYNSPPPPLGTSATAGNPITISSASVDTFLLIDITATVQGWLANPASNNGVALAGVGNAGYFSFDSKEALLTSHEPELEIALANGIPGRPGPQGPQGLQGPQGAQGVQGPVGPIGPSGPLGPVGPVGPMGLQGLPGVAGTNGKDGTNGQGFNFTGPFNASTAYKLDDVSTFNGSSYNATTSISAGAPTPDLNPQWALLARAGAPGPAGAAGSTGPQGPQGPGGLPGTPGALGPMGFPGPQGIQGPIGPVGPVGPAGTSGNARMIFASFFPGNLNGTWTGGRLTLDQPITVLRIAATAKTPTNAACPAAVFRFTDGTKGQDLVLAPGAYWSDSGPITLTFAAGQTLQASLRTGSTCSAANSAGTDANLLVEYKMQASGDTDSCSGTVCSNFCETLSSDPGNCGTCGTACASGTACTNGVCGSAGGCSPSQILCAGICVDPTSNTNCGACGVVCSSPTTCGGGGAPGQCGFTPSNCSPNCGTGASCAASADCVSRLCSAAHCAAATCSDGVKNGTETDIDCGGSSCPACATGKVCTSGTDCASGNCLSGVCVAPCSAGQTSCSGACVNTATDTNNCAACGRVCNAPNATPVCSNSTCVIASCRLGFADCNGFAPDGCEVNTQNDVNNCGGCGIVCPSGFPYSHTCVSGQCH